MPQFCRVIGLDDEFHRSKIEPIIINDLPSKSEDDRDIFMSLIRETYSTDMVSILPRCHSSCGELKGEHVIGQVCDKCGHTVKQIIEDDITPSLWFRRPQGIEKLLNPIVWIMINQRFSPSKFSILQWLTDRGYTTSIKMPPVVQRMIDAGIPRGYNSFVQNFDSIMAWLFDQTEFKLKKGYLNQFVDMLELTHPSKDPLQQLIADNRAILFSDYIPIPNRSLLVIEKAALETYVDKTTFGIHDALNTMLSIDRDYYDKTIASVENRTGKIMAMLTGYYYSYFREHISPKEGLMRKHIFGTRGNHGFRAVITSHEDIADHDEIHIPWCVGVTVWRLHIINRLMNRELPYGGLTHNEAVELIFKHVYKYHPVLDDIMQHFINSNIRLDPDLPLSKRQKGVPVLMQRNQE